MGLKEIADAGSKKGTGLKKFNKDNSKYVIFEDGEAVVGICKGYVPSVDPRNPEKQVIVFTLTIDGKDRIWTTSSKRAIAEMGAVEEEFGFPAKVSITRTGVEYETRYAVKVVE